MRMWEPSGMSEGPSQGSGCKVSLRRSDLPLLSRECVAAPGAENRGGVKTARGEWVRRRAPMPGPPCGMASVARARRAHEGASVACAWGRAHGGVRMRACAWRTEAVQRVVAEEAGLALRAHCELRGELGVVAPGARLRGEPRLTTAPWCIRASCVYPGYPSGMVSGMLLKAQI